MGGGEEKEDDGPLSPGLQRRRPRSGTRLLLLLSCVGTRGSFYSRPLMEMVLLRVSGAEKLTDCTHASTSPVCTQVMALRKKPIRSSSEGKLPPYYANWLAASDLLGKPKRTVSCVDFLRLCNLPQYEECLHKNLGSVGGLLVRDKLEKVKAQHLPQMNVQQFGHIKDIMSSVRSLKHKTKDERRLDGLPMPSGDAYPGGRRDEWDSQPVVVKAVDSAGRVLGYGTKDGNAGKHADKKTAKLYRRASLAGIRGGHKRSNRVRSMATDLLNGMQPPMSSAIVGERMVSSAGGEGSQTSSSDQKKFSLLHKDPTALATARDNRRKSLGYGNQALRTNTIEQGLKLLTRQVIERFREIIGCDRASLMYNDANSEELVFWVDDQCIRFSNVSGIAGYCLQTGEPLNIEDAYSDQRFNPEVDKKTGYKTKTILARPIYARFGGNIIAVVEMINKHDNGVFNKQDEEVLESCCMDVCDALESRFTELLTSLTALTNHRQAGAVDSHAVSLSREIKDLNSLHEAFLAKMESRNAHMDSRYMRVNEPPGQMSNDMAKRKRRTEYADTWRSNNSSSNSGVGATQTLDGSV